MGTGKLAVLPRAVFNTVPRKRFLLAVALPNRAAAVLLAESYRDRQAVCRVGGAATVTTAPTEIRAATGRERGMIVGTYERARMDLEKDSRLLGSASKPTLFLFDEYDTYFSGPAALALMSSLKEARAAGEGCLLHVSRSATAQVSTGGRTMPALILQLTACKEKSSGDCMDKLTGPSSLAELRPGVGEHLAILAYSKAKVIELAQRLAPQ